MYIYISSLLSDGPIDLNGFTVGPDDKCVLFYINVLEILNGPSRYLQALYMKGPIIVYISAEMGPSADCDTLSKLVSR